MDVFTSRYRFNEYENWEGLSNRVGTHAANVEQSFELQEKWQKKYAEMIYNMWFLSGGRILRNSGRPRGTLFNCYAKSIDDTIEDIAYTGADSMILWAEGGGVGFNATFLRPFDAPIIQKGGESSGPVSFLTGYNAFAETIKTGGSRRAAALAMMLASHPDIFNFINAKVQNFSGSLDQIKEALKDIPGVYDYVEKKLKYGELNNFNISVGVTEKFLDAVERKDKWDLHFNRKVYDIVEATDVWDLIMKNMVECAEPGLINWDYLRSNNSYYFDPIVVPNPCGEVPLGHNGVCCLGSLVLPNFITGKVNTNWQLLEDVCHRAVRFLDNIIQVNRYPDRIPGIKKKAFESRRIGIGIMGLAEYLFAKKMRYGSPIAIDAIEKLMRNIRNYVYEASIKLAEEKGAFPKFDPILYSKSHFIRTLPNQMKMDIKKYGIRNVTLQAVAPTGTISLLPEVTSSAEPLPFKAYVRADEVGNRAYIHPIYKDIIEQKKATPDWYVDSHDLKPEDHLETQVVVQKYIDGAVSKTINLPKGTKPDQLSYLMLNYIRDLKGVTAYVDGSKEGQILNPITKTEARKYLQEGKANGKVDEETTECATGTCSI
jgi:ribonucleoside-diphosphate reductase alpha chain